MTDTKAEQDVIAFLNNMGLPKRSKDDATSGQNDMEKIFRCLSGLDDDQALGLAYTCDQARNFNAFIYGAALVHLRAKCVHFTNLEMETFEEMVLREFGISCSEAYDYMAFYESLKRINLDLGKVNDLEWAKLKLSAKNITEYNFHEWMRISEGMYMCEIRDFNQN